MGTIKYNVIPRKDPIDKTVKYYAEKVSAPRILTDELFTYMAQNSQIPRAQVPIALNAILKSIQTLCLNGHSIQIPQLGNFRAIIKGKGVENKEDFSAKDIKSVLIRFRPATFFDDLSRVGISFERTTLGAAE